MVDVKPETSEKLGETLTKVVEAAPGHVADYKLVLKGIATVFVGGAGMVAAIYFSDHQHYTWEAIKEGWKLILAGGFGAVVLKFSPNPLSTWKYEKTGERRKNGRDEFDEDGPSH